MLAGAAGGFAGGVTGTLLAGGNIGQALKAGVIGGAIGAASGFLNFAAGCTSASSSIGQMLENAGKHAFVDMYMGGIRAAVYGGEGSPIRDMIGGALSSVGNGLINEHMDDMVLKVTSSAVLGGTISEIGGGKFANGAVTGAYSMLFNEAMHRAFTNRQLKKIYDAYPKPGKQDEVGLKSDGIDREELYKLIGGDVEAIYLEYKGNPDYSDIIGNTCAVRLSRALNYSGLPIPVGTAGTATGADGKAYFFNALKMKAYLSKQWGTPAPLKANWVVHNAIIFQTGFQNASGHLDVVYRRNAGSEIHKDRTTYLWH